VLEGLRRRDLLDASRAVAPMSRAADAIEIETDGVDPQSVIARIVALAQTRGVRLAERT